MLSTVFAKTLRDQRKALAWWGLGVVGTVLMYAGFWPNVRDNAGQFQEYLESLPEAIRSLMGDDFTTPAGYLQAELFSLMGPILLMVYAIGAGSRAIAGEEEAGTLDLLLSTPVTRRRVLLDKFGSMVGATFLLAALIWGSVLLLGAPFDLRPDLANLSSATANLFLLGLSFGCVALAVGSATGSKGLAMAVSGGLALVTFIVNTLAPSVDALGPLQKLSPFYYYMGNQPLINGFDPFDTAMLAGISVAALAVALITFERRDLAT